MSKVYDESEDIGIRISEFVSNTQFLYDKFLTIQPPPPSLKTSGCTSAIIYMLVSCLINVSVQVLSSMCWSHV